MQFLKSSLAAAIVVGSFAMASETLAMPLSNVAPAVSTDAQPEIQKVWWRYGYGWRRPYGYGYGWRRPWIYGYGPGPRWGGGYGYGWHNRRLVGSRAR